MNTLGHCSSYVVQINKLNKLLKKSNTVLKLDNLDNTLAGIEELGNF